MPAIRLMRVAALSVIVMSCAGVNPLEEPLPDYSPVAVLAGDLTSVGSDTLNDMMALWQEDFRKLYPNVNAQLEGKGATTALPALIEGRSQLGPMGREPKPPEQQKFERAFGYKATVLRVALDAMAVYVNKDNPLDEITLEQLDAIYSTSRKGGHPEDIRTWGQLGLKGDWAHRAISNYNRNSASGSYGFFKDVVLKGGDFKDTATEMPGSSSCVLAVTDDRYGIAYIGLRYGTPGVKKLRIAAKAGERFVAAESANIYNGTYPLRRYLYVAIDKPPGKALSPLVREFCTFILSKPGQRCVDRDGYFPLTATIAREQLKKLGNE